MDARRPARRRGRRARIPIRIGALGCAALLLPACAGPGLARREHALEARLRESAPLAAPAGSDPVAQAAVLERGLLVSEVLRRNPTLQAARHAWRAALARYPQVTSLDDPRLGLGAAPRSFGSREVDDGWMLDVSQAFPFPGKLALRGEVALGEAEAAAHDHAAVRLRLATMASLLLDDYYLAERSLEINAEHVALLEGLRAIAETRYAVGEASQQAPLQAEVELAHLDHDGLVLRTERRVTVEQLNLLLHRFPELPLPPPPRTLELPPIEAIDPDRLLVAALADHPELSAARARVGARESAVLLARREFLPDLELVGRYDRLWQERDLQPFVGLNVNVPLRLARRRGALDEAQAELERARSEEASLADEVRFAVASGVARFQEAHHVLFVVRDKLLPPARDQVEAARAAFETGRGGFLELIDAQRSLLEAELGHEETIANVSRRHAELRRASGALPGLP